MAANSEGIAGMLRRRNAMLRPHRRTYEVAMASLPEPRAMAANSTTDAHIKIRRKILHMKSTARHARRRARHACHDHIFK